MADDELWGVRNAFFLGCYQQAISEALEGLSPSEQETLQGVVDELAASLGAKLDARLGALR